MARYLQGIAGPGGAVQISLENGRRVIVGRLETCDVSIPGDSFISGRHFEINVVDEHLHLRDLNSSNGTFVNGMRVLKQELLEKDTIVAGGTTFRVEPNGEKLPTVLEALSNLRDALFGVLDTAHDPTIYPMLVSSGVPYWCLYHGKSAVELEAVAPYLVYFPPQCEFLEVVINHGWGDSWGIFLTSRQAAEVIWHELRRSLFVIMPNEEQAYFRFYDPRVLRTFLPTANSQQMLELCGTVSAFIVEGETPDTLLHFHSLQETYRLDKMSVRAQGKGNLGGEPSPDISSTRLVKSL